MAVLQRKYLLLCWVYFLTTCDVEGRRSRVPDATHPKAEKENISENESNERLQDCSQDCTNRDRDLSEEDDVSSEDRYHGKKEHSGGGKDSSKEDKARDKNDDRGKKSSAHSKDNVRHKEKGDDEDEVDNGSDSNDQNNKDVDADKNESSFDSGEQSDDDDDDKSVTDRNNKKDKSSRDSEKADRQSSAQNSEIEEDDPDVSRKGGTSSRRSRSIEKFLTSRSCPWGTVLKSSRLCVRFSTSKNSKQFHQAEKQCQKYGGELFKPYSLTIVEDIKVAIDSRNHRDNINSYWIGLSKNGQRYRWTDGTTLSWVHWASSMKFDGSRADCAVAVVDDDHRWTDENCNRKHSYICQFGTVDGNWSVWEAWSACSVTCGSGNQVRQRECNSPAPSSGGQECQGDNSEKKACNPAECEDWEAWSTYSVTYASGNQFRQRECNSPAPSGGGLECHWDNSETKACSRAECEVDGNWSLWEEWSACSVTCGSGNQVRQRECNSPAPSGGGQECHGDNSETKACSLAECEVDGNWSVWEAWSDCSVSCGSGNQVRQRKCNSPAPSGGGQECPGENSEKKACSLADCEVDGNWSVWQAWSACSATCGAGNQVRKRECNSPAPSGGGQECRGDHSETQTCNLSECSVDGNWSVWKAWSPCSVTCGAGNQVRQRMCNNPAPSGGGQQCQGDTSQTQACQTSECIVDGNWSSWEAWSACSATCGTGDQARLRKCNNPAPSGGGQMCLGDKSEAQSCTVSECMVSVDGSWSNWEAWTACLVTCGTGRQTRMRKCDNPAPSGGGQECQGDISETQSCGLSECRVDGNWSIWESWSACSVTCGIGNQFRQRKCNNPAPSGGGQECSGDKTGIQSCRVAECAGKPRLKEALFEIAAEGYGLQGCELVRLRRTSLVQCALDCVNTILCKSFNFEFGLSENMTRNHSCILNSATRFERPLDYVTMEGYQLYSLGPKL